MSLPADRLAWLLCNTPSQELQRTYHKHAQAVHNLPPVQKAALIRNLVARAINNGAQLYETSLQIGLNNVRRGGIDLPTHGRSAGGDMPSQAVVPEASVVSNVILSTCGIELTTLKRLIDHPSPSIAEGGGTGTGGSATGGTSSASDNTLSPGTAAHGGKGKALSPGPGEARSSAVARATAPSSPLRPSMAATSPSTINLSSALPGGVHVDMVTLLSLLPGPMATHVLHHLHTEAMAVIRARHDGSTAWHWPIKIYCDFDDTVQARLFDRSYPSGTTYPGFVPFIRALRGEFQLQHPSAPRPRHARSGTDDDPAHNVIEPTSTLPASSVVQQSKEAVAPQAGDAPAQPEHQVAPASADELAQRPSSGGSSGARGRRGSGGRSTGLTHPPGAMPLRSGMTGRSRVWVVSDIALTGMHADSGSAARGVALRRVQSGFPISSEAGAQAWMDAGSQGDASASPSVRALSLSAQDATVADLVFLSARPAFMRSHTLDIARSLGLGHAAVLCGTIAQAISHTRLAARKLRNHLLHHAMFAEHRVMFVGDSGQADVRFASLMLQAHNVMYKHALDSADEAGTAPMLSAASTAAPTPLPGADILAAREDEEGQESSETAMSLAQGLAQLTDGAGRGSAKIKVPPPLALIHDICGIDQQRITSSLQRARLRALGIHMFDSYVEASLIAAQQGFLSVESLETMVEHTTRELAAVSFSPANELQRVLRLQEYTMAVRRSQQWLAGQRHAT